MLITSGSLPVWTGEEVGLKHGVVAVVLGHQQHPEVAGLKVPPDLVGAAQELGRTVEEGAEEGSGRAGDLVVGQGAQVERLSASVVALDLGIEDLQQLLGQERPRPGPLLVPADRAGALLLLRPDPGGAPGAAQVAVATLPDLAPAKVPAHATLEEVEHPRGGEGRVVAG